MYRVRIGGIEGIERLLRERGENPVALLASTGLSPAQLRDPDQYIAYTKMAELLHVCSEACKEPLFGLLLGQRQGIGVLGALPLIASRASTVAEAIKVAERYLYLHASGLRLVLSVQETSARLELSIAIGQSPGFEQLMQLSLAQAARFLAVMADSDPYALPIYLRQPRPQDGSGQGVTQYQHLHFDQSFDGVGLAAQYLARPAHLDVDTLNRHLEEYVGRLQTLYPNQLEEQVADVISRLLPTGECSLAEIAATLNLRPRTLQARLSARGTGYGDILRETRFNLACQHLSEPRVSITELALQLGYADVAVFSRHFKAWSGHSPRAWRNNQGAMA
ncbi:AraC family transcriptional regulator [Parahaliea maris]|uniref:AraC family transcriptional regulator n=1 Tax=Parahaliea maris TaxID=2716870 RepID=A0A5C8ZZK6_9GAMM|nr:AraC family transcriptional regulator [Parahaliea maris]TXS92960.1 AraC family transcriptional regulator [Parahaliea maris]